ncbi:hypothetical protein [Mucilaginibacter sp. KACC 22063]|uniref:hypothetical protein n=1 Tax=Mucilaginibacter sp. KACC 22063 TaxID=3025666 RepID=UPI002366988E|nr:hypothetical protein [Mucilaginibacter sp. KACC 22063]WDF55886.1 hypothetical protein PQ461_02270 [Mucilaginibacter sp. KACC 22063]
MKKRIVLLAILCVLSICCFAQDSSYEKSLEFLQGDGVYESGMMTFLGALKESIWSNFDLFINDAKALSAIFMIIYFAIKSYEMMAGDKKLEVMPLLRPFGLAMVILWWGGFAKMVAFPTDLVASETEQMFASEQNNVNQLRFQRADLMKQVADSLYTFQAQTEVAAKESDTWYGQAWDAVTSTVKEGISTVVAPLMELKARLQISIQLLMTQILELTGIWILRIATYIICAPVEVMY